MEIQPVGWRCEEEVLGAGQAPKVNRKEGKTVKKLFIGLVSVVFTAGIFVVPAMAKSVFNVAIIPCGAAVPLGSAGADGCGSNPAASDPLIGGRVRVNDNGK